VTSGFAVEGVVPLLDEDGIAFRDRNRNGRLDPFEDPRRPVDERVTDLLAQMTLEEKAGMLFHQGLGVGSDGSLVEEIGPFSAATTSDLVGSRLLTHFNIYATPEPRLLAEWHNRLQRLAERTRLAIPVTISSDPRHGFSANPATSWAGGHFSQWPEPLGLASTRDAGLVAEFADIARQEYTAVGIRVALHPSADLATEPRWARAAGTFGEDARLAASMVGAYVRGFQGDTLGPTSVACVTKHFPGGGPQRDGEDPHFAYGREQVYPGDHFDYHLVPFEAALQAGTAQIMPYYGMPVGTALEEVGFGFNRGVITGLLREHFGFEGVVLSDWGLLSDTPIAGTVWPARAWGVEHLDLDQRMLKALDAGVDQFGGEMCVEALVGLVLSGRLPEERLDVSVRRLLRDKFRLGLFDDPYVDPDAAAEIVGQRAFRERGDLAQRRAIVLLKDDGQTLPVAGRPKLFVEGLAAEAVAADADVVAHPADADLALVRLQTPFEPRESQFLEQFFHAGRLDFEPDELRRLLDLLHEVPTIVEITLDRAAVIPELAEHAVVLLASFGASDAAVIDVVCGRFAPSGRLPIELPSSMAAAERQLPDVPYDSDDPMFPFGAGLDSSSRPRETPTASTEAARPASGGALAD
jgi:beta-glucosidase